MSHPFSYRAVASIFPQQRIDDGDGGPNVSHLDGYQEASRRTWSLVRTDHPIIYPTLGLANEVGEVAGKIKKIFRDRDGVITDDDRRALTLELGDVLWYLAQICTELDVTLEDVAA